MVFKAKTDYITCVVNPDHSLDGEIASNAFPSKRIEQDLEKGSTRLKRE